MTRQSEPEGWQVVRVFSSGYPEQHTNVIRHGPVFVDRDRAELFAAAKAGPNATRINGRCSLHSSYPEEAECVTCRPVPRWVAPHSSMDHLSFCFFTLARELIDIRTTLLDRLDLLKVWGLEDPEKVT